MLAHTRYMGLFKELAVCYLLEDVIKPTDRAVFIEHYYELALKTSSVSVEYLRSPMR
jgi:hypothetical protein